VLDRINSVSHQRTRSAGLLPSFNEAHVGERAETHVARVAIQSEAVNPGPRTARLYLQIQTGAVVMQANLRERAHLCFGELLDEARHENPPVGHTHVPQRPYTSHEYLLRSFVQYGRYGKDFYRHPLRHPYSLTN
jgi:hypothetical protein